MKHEGTRALSNYKSIKELMRKIEDLDTNDKNQIRKVLGQMIGMKHKNRLHLKKYLKTEDKTDRAKLRQQITHCIQKYYTEVVTSQLV